MGKYGLRFDTIESVRELSELGDFLRTHVGNYSPTAHEKWVSETCLPGIAADERRALAWWSHDEMIGDAVIKVARRGVVEVKNFRLATERLGGYGLGGFMMGVAVKEAVDLLTEKHALPSDAESFDLILDVTKGNPAVSFYERCGFEVIGEANGLYLLGQTELYMHRTVALA